MAQAPGERYQVMRASQLARIVRADSPAAVLPSARGIAFNSGRVRPGDAFFALPGANQHGIAYADDALRRGAAFVVSDRPHPRGLLVEDPEQALLALGRHARSAIVGSVVAITGSVGKTTTKAFAAAALDAHSSEGNLNTPLALSCSLFDSYLADPTRTVVLELGIDHPGEMDLLLELVRPTHGLLTAVAESHLERLGDLKGVAAEKAKLLAASPERFASREAARQLPRALAGLISYGLEPDAAFRGSIVATNSDGQTIEAMGTELRLPFPGRAMAINAIGALALVRNLGLDPEAAARRLERARLEPGRLERKQAGKLTLLDDTYNSNPASAREALEVLRRFPGPRIAILGDMLELGDHSARLHRELGESTTDIELVIAVGPESRQIATANPAALHAPTVDEAFELLDRIPEAGTVLFKASRGVRLERLVTALQESRRKMVRG